MMKLVGQTSAFGRRFSDKEAVKLLKEIGYDAIDYSMFVMDDDAHLLNNEGYAQYAKDLRAYADSLNIPFVQAHAPFGFTLDDEIDFENKIVPKIVRAMEIASILGVEIIVVHPIHQSPYVKHEQEMKEKNLKFYNLLVPYCEKFGIKVAVENMWKHCSFSGKISVDVCSDEREFADYIDSINSDYITACLDLGHCGLTGFSAADAIETLGNRLGCLHVHDNDHKDDLHTAPYLGKMDWDAITKALAKTNYEGNFTFECDCGFIVLFEDEFKFTANKFLYDIGRYLISKIEKAKV